MRREMANHIYNSYYIKSLNAKELDIYINFMTHIAYKFGNVIS